MCIRLREDLGGKGILNLKVGRVYGKEWMDVSGEEVMGKRD